MCLRPYQNGFLFRSTVIGSMGVRVPPGVPTRFGVLPLEIKTPLFKSALASAGAVPIAPVTILEKVIGCEKG